MLLLIYVLKGNVKSRRVNIDEEIGNVDIGLLCSQIDELHTMTSLLGFEALLRGVRVKCYGLPFYAGWGLTTDEISCRRRQRKLSLEDLIYGVLIAYPRYLHPVKHVFIEPEQSVMLLEKSAREGIKTRGFYSKLRRSIIITVKKFID